MSERVIDIGKRGLHLRVANGLLSISDGDVVENVPLMDIGTLVLAESAISLTGAVLSELASRDAVIVVCDRKYSPSGMLFPLNRSAVHDAQRRQASMREPLKKRLWKELVKRKIVNQSAVLLLAIGEDAGLSHLVSEVRSGDNTNIESRAAVAFWKSLPFIEKRDRNRRDVNILFNYAYMILWSAVARALCAAGLNPNLGICHHNKYNPFCLASDVMEPYRFLAEIAVLRVCSEFNGSLTSAIKKNLLKNVFHTEFNLNKRKHKLTDGALETAASLRRSVTSGAVEIKLPKMMEAS